MKIETRGGEGVGTIVIFLFFSKSFFFLFLERKSLSPSGVARSTRSSSESRREGLTIGSRVMNRRTGGQRPAEDPLDGRCAWVQERGEREPGFDMPCTGVPGSFEQVESREERRKGLREMHGCEWFADRWFV